MIASWLLFPVLLGGLCLGCGLLLELVVGRRLPGHLLAPIGFMVQVVVAELFTASGETAGLATPAVLLMALTGIALTFPWRGRQPDRWALIAALAVFAVYGAPVLLSGEPTFTGYIKLDDTATWMAFVDRLMEHGRDLSGLEPSSYQATLQANFPGGYPVGAFLPLGVGSRLTGVDVAWLVQPYMATIAALLGLCMYWLTRGLVESRPMRAVVSFGAAQSALLFAYGLWGGIKELAVALAIAALAALAPSAARTGETWRTTLPAAIATIALLAMVGFGGVVWALPVLAIAAASRWERGDAGALARRALPLLLVVGLFCGMTLLSGGSFSPTQGGLTSASEIGNLVRPLELAQYGGVWITGDFRLDPSKAGLTYFLIGLVVAATIAGAWLGWRRGGRGPLLYAAGATIGSVAVFAYSSPWVGAKALASGSPALLLLALAGTAAFAARVERVLGVTVLALILGGVLWSNALGYHDASLAPYDQLRELENIGNEFAGEGPTLMTEYQPYGVRHFLRKMDAEGASELRARPVPLVGGGELEKGDWADTDQISLPALLTYRTLVLRRNPLQSRPPSAYSLVRHGDYYEVWQRPAAPASSIAEHRSLGNLPQHSATRDCAEVKELAREAGRTGVLAAAVSLPSITVSLSEMAHPDSWISTEAGSSDLVPHGPGTAHIAMVVPRTGIYDLFLRGGTRNRLALSIDGSRVGSVKMQLNEPRQFLDFGRAKLGKGRHEVDLALDDQTLSPGSGGVPEPVGPLLLRPVPTEDRSVLSLHADRADSLCGRRLDWVEAIRR